MTEKQLVLLLQDYQLKLKLLIRDDLLNAVPKDKTKTKVIKLATSLEKEISDYDKQFSLKARRSLIECFARWYKKAFADLLATAITAASVMLLDKLKTIDQTIDVTDLLSKSKSKTQSKIMYIQTPEAKEQMEKGFNPRDYQSNSEAGSANLTIKNYDYQVQDSIKAFKDAGLTTVEVDKNGHPKRVSIRNRAEMLVRFNARVEDCNRLRAKGIKLVVASSHADASERCSYWQGKIFLLDTESLETTGQYNKKTHKPSPHPIGRTEDDREYYSIKEALSYGFLGYNCRHRLTEYMENMQLPKQYPDSIRRKKSDIEAMQRALERNIRIAKENQVLAITPGERRKWINISQYYQSRYAEYCKKHNLVRIDWRCSISMNEREFINN